MNRSRVARALQALRDEQRREAFTAERACFDLQTGFLRAPGRRKVLRCSRRAGKSQAFAAGLLEAVVRPPFTNVVYAAPTFKRARRILWATLKRLNREHQLGGVANETEASLAFPHLGDDVHLYLSGLKDRGEADKARGFPWKLFAIDEAQDLREDVLSYALTEVIEPGVIDHAGSLWVGGTPGPAKVGFFYDVDEGAKRDGWVHRSWTWRENPLLPSRLAGSTVEEIERVLLDEFKLDPSSSSWLREWCGVWAEDLDALVFQYDAVKNAGAWQAGPQPGWTYLVAFDIGIEDADAVAVIGWAAHERRARLVWERVRRGQDVTDLASLLREAVDTWKPYRLVGDLGALGKKIGEEFRRRFSLPVEAADKARKLEGIALLNAALRKGDFTAPTDSVFAADAKKVMWDLDARAKGRAAISDRYHSDITDAVLYGYRAALHFLEQDPPPKPSTEIEERRARIAAEMKEREQRAAERKWSGGLPRPRF